MKKENKKMVSIPAAYSGDPAFLSLPRDPLPYLRFFVFYRSHYGLIP